MEKKKESVNQKFRFAGMQTFSSAAGVGFANTVGTNYIHGVEILPFTGDGVRIKSQNTYPQVIAEINRNSPTSSVCINVKSRVICGSGVDYDSLDRDVQDFFRFINDKDEDIEEILASVTNDFVEFNGFALKVFWNNAGKVVQIEHVPFPKVRLGRPDTNGKVKYAVVSNNWDINNSTAIPELTEVFPLFNPETFKEITVVNNIRTLSEDQQANGVQLFYYKKRDTSINKTTDFYPLPSYISAMDSIITEMNIQISNTSVLQNGIGGKYIFKFAYKPQTDEEYNDLNTQLLGSFTNASNNGGIISLFAENESQIPVIDKVEPLEADVYVNLDNNVVSKILRAHDVPPILAGVDSAGAFSQRGSEIVTAYTMFDKTHAATLRKDIIKAMCKVLRYTEYEITSFTVKPLDFGVLSLKEELQLQQNTSLNNEQPTN